MIICPECENPSWTGREPIVVPHLPTGDKFLEFKTREDFPATGEGGFIYIDAEKNDFYKWDIEAEEYTTIGGAPGDSDVVDIVNTYAELLAYDTSKLKDRDIVKVLADETHDDKVAYYRWLKATSEWTFIGAQGPYYTKAQTDELLEDKVDVVEGKGLSSNDYTDAEKAKLGGLANIKTIGENLELDANGVLNALGGGVKTLTSDDYNYPVANPTGVALWLLDAGLYTVDDASTKVYSDTDATASALYEFNYWLVAKKTNYPFAVIYGFGSPTGGTLEGFNSLKIEYVQENGSKYMVSAVLNENSLVNALTFTGAGRALDARQGKVLKDLIDTRVPEPTAGDAGKFLKGDGTWGAAGIPKVATEPDISTVGEPGDVVVCTETGNVHMFICTAKDTVNNEYTWQRLAFMNTDIQLIVSQNALSVGGDVGTSNHTLDASDTTATLGDNALNI